MSNVLIILAHPNFTASNANKALLENISIEENVIVHNIYEAYPDGKIDIAKEQELISEHSRIIFQFPTYWFNAPGFLKTWIDEVFSYGWAYGPNGTALVEKEFGIATTTGGVKESYLQNGEKGFTVDDYLTPISGSIKYTGAKYIGQINLNDSHNLTDENVKPAQELYKNLIFN